MVQEDGSGDDEKKGRILGKGKQVVQVTNSGDDLDAFSGSDDEEVKFNFPQFTETDLKEQKFAVGQLFSSIELCKKAVREYSCKERLGITFLKKMIEQE